MPKYEIDGLVNLTAATVWSLRESFEGGSYKQFFDYAKGIARREVKSWRRQVIRQRRRPEPLADTCSLFAGRRDAYHGANPEEIAAALEALRNLGPMELRVVKARYEGYTFEETAQQTGLPRQRVWEIYEKALKRLRELP